MHKICRNENMKMVRMLRSRIPTETVLLKIENRIHNKQKTFSVSKQRSFRHTKLHVCWSSLSKKLLILETIVPSYIITIIMNACTFNTIFIVSCDGRAIIIIDENGSCCGWLAGRQCRCCYCCCLMRAKWQCFTTIYVFVLMIGDGSHMQNTLRKKHTKYQHTHWIWESVVAMPRCVCDAENWK